MFDKEEQKYHVARTDYNYEENAKFFSAILLNVGKKCRRRKIIKI